MLMFYKQPTKLAILCHKILYFSMYTVYNTFMTMANAESGRPRPEGHVRAVGNLHILALGKGKTGYPEGKLP